jgi:hypothetical protein
MTLGYNGRGRDLARDMPGRKRLLLHAGKTRIRVIGLSANKLYRSGEYWCDISSDTVIRNVRLPKFPSLTHLLLSKFVSEAGSNQGASC